MIASLTYSKVPPELCTTYATLHRCVLSPGMPTTVPALLGQVWLCTTAVWWLPRGTTTPELLPSVTIVGPTTAAFQLTPESEGSLIGCGLWPLGWAEIVRLHAGEAADRALDARHLWPEVCDRWTVATKHATSEEERWAALQEAATTLAATAEPSTDAHNIHVIDSWLDSNGDTDRLCAELRLSSRQTARVTGRTHGGPPRLIAGKWRALRAAAELGFAGEQSAAVWERYADQSHFIREFRRFIGPTPGSFAGEPNSIPHRVVADSWHLESDHPLALSRPGQPLTF